MKFSNLADEMFYQALRIRRVEEKIVDLYPSDKIQSPVHLSIGQEAVAVGVSMALRKTDLLFCSYRSHSFYLAKGGDLRQMFAELYGKSSGCCGGKGGSMHLAAPEVGLMGASAVVASTIPHAVGAALAAKQLKKDQVIVSVFGDGATDEGVYHESLNFAMLHKLPVIFLCENNGLAVHSKAGARQSYRILDHAKAYGLKTYALQEGYDFEKVYQTFSACVESLKKNASPVFVEIKTYRYKEHVGIGEDHTCGYRSPEELKIWKAKDPLCTDETKIAAYQPAIEKEIEDAVQFAEKSPWPTADDLLRDTL